MLHKNLPKKREASHRGPVRSLKRVRCVDTGIIYEGVADAANALSFQGILVPPEGIRNACNGTQKKAGGRRWEYATIDGLS